MTLLYLESLELGDMLLSLIRTSRRNGLRMNFDKTKAMMNVFVVPRPIFVEGIAPEVVREYVYLEQVIHFGRHKFEKKDDRRIRLGWAAFVNSVDLWHDFPENNRSKRHNL